MPTRILRCLSVSLLSFALGWVLTANAQVSGPPSANCHVTDGTFTTCPGDTQEWSDVTPAAFPASNSFLYVNQDAAHQFLYLMYDFPFRTAKIAPTDSVHVSFYTVEQPAGVPVLITYDVYIMGNGEMQILQQGKPTPPGRILSAAGFHPSPNSSTPHLMAELQVPLSQGPPSTYSPDPLAWTASVPTTPPTPPDPPSCPVTVLGVCVKSQGQIDAWSQEASADYNLAEADYTTDLMACNQLGQEAESSTAAFAQASLASATSLYSAQLSAVASAASQLNAVLQMIPKPPPGSLPSGTIGQILQATKAGALPAVIQAVNALQSLAENAPISSPTLYLTVNLNVYLFAQKAVSTALATADSLVAAAGATSAVVTAELVPLVTALGVAAAAFEAGIALEVAFAEAVAAVAQAVSAACDAAVAALTAPEFALAAYYELLAEDPPDPNFTVIATPVVPSLSAQPLTTATGFNTQVVADMNALIANSEHEIALLRVIPTSVNRVAGAVAAGNTIWQTQQANAVRQYASELIPLASNETSLRAALASDLTASGLVFTFTANNVFNFLGPLQQNGLPSSVTNALTQLGVDATTQSAILKSAISTSPASVASLGTGAFPQALLDPALTSAANAAISALAELAAVPPATSLTESFNFTIAGDYTAAGIGLRGNTGGNIAITAVPAGAAVQKALLYWGALDNGEDATLKQLTFNNTAITGTRIGSGPDTCWGRTNSFTYRADVTPFVSGNGTYALSNVASGGSILADGASLVVVYQVPGAPVKTIFIDDGNISIPQGTPTGTASFGAFTAASPVSATTTFVVGDGQGFGSNTSFTGSAGTIFFPGVFQGLDGAYWDTDTFNVSSAVGAGSDTGSAQILVTGDCLLWSAQPFSVTSTAVSAQPVTATAGVVEAGANGNTVVNLRGLAPGDAPTLQDQIQAIVQFRIIQNPSLSGPALTAQLVSGLVNDGVISASEGASIETAVNNRVVAPPIGTKTTVSGMPGTNLTAGQPLTLNIAVSATSGTAIPTGTVTLGSPNTSATVTVTVTLNPSGQATVHTIVPAAGTYSLFATYNGAPGFAMSVSPTLTQTVNP